MALPSRSTVIWESGGGAGAAPGGGGSVAYCAAPGGGSSGPLRPHAVRPSAATSTPTAAKRLHLQSRKLTNPTPPAGRHYSRHGGGTMAKKTFAIRFPAPKF